jgi:hypothetical protein
LIQYFGVFSDPTASFFAEISPGFEYELSAFFVREWIEYCYSGFGSAGGVSAGASFFLRQQQVS